MSAINKKLVAIVGALSMIVFTDPIACAQIRAGIAFTPHVSFSSFDNSLVHKTIVRTPSLLYSVDVLLQIPFTPRIGIETGLGWSQIGYRTKEYGEDYVGGQRHEQVVIGRQSTSFFRIPVSAFFRFSNRLLFAQLGSNIQFTSFGKSGQAATTFGGTTFGNHTFSGVMEPTGTLSFSSFVGIGVEKKLYKNYILNLSLVYNYGLSKIVTWIVKYQIDQTEYTNRIMNSGSYVGLRLYVHI